MGLFDFLTETHRAPTPRTLDHPQQLQLGDMVQFEFCPQPQLSNRSFTVSRFQTLDSGGETEKRGYIWLQDGAQAIRILAAAGESIEVAMELLPDDLLQLVDQEDVMDLLDPDSGNLHRLKAIVPPDQLPELLRGWGAAEYRQEGFVKAYRYEKDYRHRLMPPQRGGGEVGCDYAWLVSPDRQHRLEFVVFDGGRTEVYIATQLPIRKIRELWPAAQATS